LGSAASARDRKLLLLPARQHAAGPFEILHEIGEELRHEVWYDAPAIRPGEGPQQDVVPDGEVWNDFAALRHVRESCPRAAERRFMTDHIVAEPNFAGRSVRKTHERLEQGGLAGAVAAEDRGDLGVANAEADPVQDMTAAKETVDISEAHHHRIPLDPR